MTRSLARLRGERGYSLIEMLTVISILGVILTGLTTLFIQGSNAQLDMNRRFESQQDARVALDKLRREIHCAQAASTTPGPGGAAPHVVLDLPGQCPTATNAAQTNVSWCTVNVATNRYALYRKVGVGCNSTGVRWADYIVTANLFDFQTQSTTQLARLRVEIPVDVKPGDATPPYELCDTMVLRNSSRVAPTASTRGYDDTAEPAAC